jgi:Tol biopolymer transport system component
MINIKNALFPVFFIVLFIPFTGKAQNNKMPVAAMPQLFEEGIVSTRLSERDMAISPDGNEMFYTVQLRASGFQTIVHRSKLKDGRWSAPQVAAFSGHYSDLEPAFSADGKKLFFCSNRPINGEQAKDFDIWVMEKQESGWGLPKNIGTPVNTEKDEFFPSVAQNGNLYFTATKKSGIGREDIFVARWENRQYTEPQVLDSAINSAFFEFNACITPDEQCILFSSFGRPGEKGGGDLYISIKDANGRWQPAKNCVMLNSEKLDYCPFVSFDKKTLYFTSERHNISSSFPGKPVTYLQLQDISTSVLNGNGNIFSIPFSDVLHVLSGN